MVNGLYTDLYELRMAQGYFLYNKHETPAVFEYTFRSLPFGGGWLVFCGLKELLEQIQNFRYDEEAIYYLKSLGFRSDFLSLLQKRRFAIDIYAVEEGTLVFPYTPIVRLEGALMDLQLLETLVLNFLNFSSLVATKALRMRMVAGEKTLLIDFGMRRAHGLGAMLAAYAAFIGGFQATSNTAAAQRYNLPATGTMAHSWVQSMGDEYQAFLRFAECYPNNAVLLLDTYNTLNSGLPNAIKVAKYLEQKGQRLLGVRLDSGDAIALSKKVREQLDQVGLSYVKILFSNQVDEYAIERYKKAQAPIDGYGVGTRLVTAYDEPALDGIYKLVELNGKAVAKHSDHIAKAVFPGKKNLYRNGLFQDFVTLAQEQPTSPGFTREQILKLQSGETIAQHSWKPLLKKVMEKGKVLYDPEPKEVQKYVLEQLAALPSELKRLKVSTSPFVWYSEGIARQWQAFITTKTL